MKQYRVFIDITVTKTFHVEAESEEQARKLAERQCRERADYYARDNDGIVDVSVSDCEEEPESENATPSPKTFGEAYEEIQHLYIEDTVDKTADIVAEEIRSKIRSMGWPCLEETETEDEWREENFPEMETLDCHSIAELDFLCDNDGACERMPGGHDVDWRTFNITFYGVWQEKGVFEVNVD